MPGSGPIYNILGQLVRPSPHAKAALSEHQAREQLLQICSFTRILKLLGEAILLSCFAYSHQICLAREIFHCSCLLSLNIREINTSPGRLGELPWNKYVCESLKGHLQGTFNRSGPHESNRSGPHERTSILMALGPHCKYQKCGSVQCYKSVMITSTMKLEPQVEASQPPQANYPVCIHTSLHKTGVSLQTIR